MKKVFMIAYEYPPTGGPGVQRTLKFSKYLPQYGWKPVVFTVKKAGLVQDPTLMREITDDVTVIRTPAFDVENAQGVLRLPCKVLSRKVLIPDHAVLWKLAMTRRAMKAVKKTQPQAIYSTSWPYSDHLMAHSIKSRFPQIPWIADFRDEWSKNPYLKDAPHPRFRMRMEANMEKKVIQAADRIIANTPIMMANFQSAYPDHAKKFVCIPNGYDASDFDQTNDSFTSHGDLCTVTYTGMFYGRRKPDRFLQALGELIDRHDIDPSRFCVRFIGKYLPGYFDEWIRRYRLEHVVSVLEYRPHRECVRMLLNSDVLLLIEGGGEGGEAFYTGKLFEYLHANRPILAIVPNKGAAAALIRSTKAGWVVDCEDTDKIRERIKSIYDRWTHHDLVYEPDRDLIRQYDRKNLTKRLAALLNVCKEEKDEVHR